MNIVFGETTDEFLTDQALKNERITISNPAVPGVVPQYVRDELKNPVRQMPVPDFLKDKQPKLMLPPGQQ